MDCTISYEEMPELDKKVVPNLLSALVTLDGLICTICGIFILCVI